MYIPVNKPHLLKEDVFSNSARTVSTSPHLVLHSNSLNCPSNQAQGLNRTCFGDMPQTVKHVSTIRGHIISFLYLWLM